MANVDTDDTSDDKKKFDAEKKFVKTSIRSDKSVNKKKVKFDWLPPNVSTNLVSLIGRKLSRDKDRPIRTLTFLRQSMIVILASKSLTQISFVIVFVS